MVLIDDPEIIEDFAQEATSLFEELEDVLEELEDNPGQKEQLELFGQIIDRVMGAANTIGVENIAKFCELGKIIGYKSSQITDVALQEIVVAVFFDTIDLLKKMVDNLKNGKGESVEGLNTDAFKKRLQWLSDKFKDIERASVSYGDGGTEASEGNSQESIDDLLESLGL